MLVLERGPHVDPRRFTDDEVDQYLRLYNEGALQLATNFSLQVLQGMCVGGGTTINNALCLPPPAPCSTVGAARLDRAALEAAIAEIRELLGSRPIRPETTTIAAQRFAKAVKRARAAGHDRADEANITAPAAAPATATSAALRGQRATLDTLLPRAQQQHGLDVLADFEVERIPPRATAPSACSAGTGRAASSSRSSPTRVVVAAGAIGSSWLLQRSGLGGDRAGKGCTSTSSRRSPPTSRTRSTRSPGSRCHTPTSGRRRGAGYLVETVQPAATQALAMPGWFDRHFANMLRYRHMACAGVLVGTTTPGRVKPSGTGRRSSTPLGRRPRPRRRRPQVAGRIWLQAGAER